MRTFIVREEADIIRAFAGVYAASRTLKLSESDRRRALVCAYDGAIRAFESGGAVECEITGGSVLELRYAPANGPAEKLLSVPGTAAISGPAADSALQDLSKLLHANGAVLDELEHSRALIETLKAELDETNRGVMALYAELEDRAEKLRRADELKSRFLSYASHELRTPLNGIVGLVRLLRLAPTPRSEDDLKQLGFIQSAAEEMRQMVNDLLDLAKVEAGKVTIQPSEFDLTFVFGALRGIFRPLLSTDDVSLVFEDTSAVPPLYSDEAKVSQILRNLLSNALKFTERGFVRVAAVAEGDTIRISVTDTGIGIPHDQLSRVFDEFSQVDSPLQRRLRGTGLGLPLCRKFAELLGGSMLAESEIGKGSVFTLVLPRAITLPEPSEPPAQRARTRSTILIVDDVEIDRYLLGRLITAGGDYDIIQAVDGQQGLEIARRQRPDLIFLDLNLPRINGDIVASELLADPVTRDIPVFIITAERLSESDFERLLPLSRGIILKERLSDTQKIDIDLTAHRVNVTLV